MSRNQSQGQPQTVFVYPNYVQPQAATRMVVVPNYDVETNPWVSYDGAIRLT